MSRKINWKMLLSAIFLVLTLAVVLSVGLSGNDLEKTVQALRNISLKVLLGCLCCWVIYLLFNSLSVYHFLKMQGKPIKLRQAIHAGMTGIFYCNVTPGATGGQPMEIYCLNKYGVSVGLSSSALAVKFIVFQTALLIAGAVLWLSDTSFVSKYIGGKTWLVLLGYLVNFFSVGMVLLMLISRKIVLWLMNLCVNITVKLKICQDGDAAKAKWENYCESFLESFQLIIRHPKDLLIQTVINLCELLAQMFVIVFLYHGFGLTGVSDLQLVTLGILLYIAASYTPLPGASGAQEGGFAIMFANVFPEGQLFVALLCWRFFTYYMSIIVGVIMTSWDNIAGLHRAVRKPEAKPTVLNTATIGETENGSDQ